MEEKNFQFDKFYSFNELKSIVNGIECTSRGVDDEFSKEGNKLLKNHSKKGVISLSLKENSLHIKNKITCHAFGCTREFDTVYEYDNHYKLSHCFTCAECKKSLPSAHFLDLHISEQHDSFFAALAERKCSFKCFLENCIVLSANAEERRDHCIREHKFPSNFPFDQVKKFKKQKNVRRRSTRSSETNMSVDEAAELLQEECRMEDNNEDEESSNDKIDATNLNKKTHPKSFTFGHGKQRTFGEDTSKD